MDTSHPSPSAGYIFLGVNTTLKGVSREVYPKVFGGGDYGNRNTKRPIPEKRDGARGTRTGEEIGVPV